MGLTHVRGHTLDLVFTLGLNVVPNLKEDFFFFNFCVVLLGPKHEAWRDHNGIEGTVIWNCYLIKPSKHNDLNKFLRGFQQKPPCFKFLMIYFNGQMQVIVLLYF